MGVDTLSPRDLSELDQFGANLTSSKPQRFARPLTSTPSLEISKRLGVGLSLDGTPSSLTQVMLGVLDAAHRQRTGWCRTMRE